MASGSKRRPQKSLKTRTSTITMADIRDKVSNMKSWTAPDPDMIHTYWLTKLSALHECLVSQMNQLLMDGIHPEWLTQRRTVLIMKDPQKGAMPSNYRPIICFYTTWKLLPGIMEAKVTSYWLNTLAGLRKRLVVT